MENVFHSLINEVNITKLLGFLFVLCLFLGVTDLQKNIEKIGD